MIVDLYLRATGKAALDNALQAAGLLSDDLNLAAGVLLDRLGALHRVAGYVGDEPVFEVVDSGYHANLRLLFEPTATQVEALYPVTILAPGEPFRVWAG